MTVCNPSTRRYQSWFASPPSPTTLSSSATAFDCFDRPSARDIQATITDEGDVEEEIEVDVSQAWLHSHAFEIMALRNSNASWDKRMTSRDAVARIRAVEQYEMKKQQQQEVQQPEEVPRQQAQVDKERERDANDGRQQQQQSSAGVTANHTPSLSLRQQQQHGGYESLAIIDEGFLKPPTFPM